MQRPPPYDRFLSFLLLQISNFLVKFDKVATNGWPEWSHSLRTRRWVTTRGPPLHETITSNAILRKIYIRWAISRMKIYLNWGANYMDLSITVPQLLLKPCPLFSTQHGAIAVQWVPVVPGVQKNYLLKACLAFLSQSDSSCHKWHSCDILGLFVTEIWLYYPIKT